MIVIKLWYFVLFLKMVSAKMTSRETEGYPLGYLSDCPGTEKEAKISRSSLSRLELFLVNDQNILFTFFNKTAFNYHRMKALARYMDFNKKTVLKVIGYLDSNYLTYVGSTMGSVYKYLGYNVLLLEYQAFSAWVYPKAARLLRPVGKHTAEMLAELTKYGLDPKKLELVGLSHGGQAVSFIAKNFRQITGKNISRVTSLDPGGPCFRHNGPEGRIDASDADFVEVIHTNSEGYGMAGAVGHIDFYVNGGEYQPGDFMTLPCTSFCSHTRAYMLWLGALFSPNSLIAMQCDSIQDARDRKCYDRKPLVTNVIGLNVDKTKQGIFYVPTSNVFPYGIGKRGLKKENDLSDLFMKEYGGDDLEVMEL